MKSIAFIDLEVQPHKGTILDIGGIKDTGSIFHSKSLVGFEAFLKDCNYLCGHNVLKHDFQYIQRYMGNAGDIHTDNIIDTLYLSALLFPRKPYHALVKDEKLQTEELNNPLSDAKKARVLFLDEVAEFHRLEDPLQRIFFLLLKDQREFRSFFRYIGYKTAFRDPVPLIRDHFARDICNNTDLHRITKEHPLALAYSLAVINVRDRFSVTPPWILKNYPEVEWITDILRNRPCLTGCPYCAQALDARRGLQLFFGFDSYRTFGGEPLQEKAVQAALDHKSLLAIFPTGGGKSITFQVPALMSGENVKGLTVIISPLQSLMKDQVDNLERASITDAVTVNGLLDPIERAKSIERVEDGSASILYISPESLRSRTMEHILLGRKIVRFVIDEAHCFSAWGQDFRVDYLCIGDFIKTLQKKKNLAEGIPVSCFTATAKQKVIEDIRSYFKEKLALDLEVFSTSATRTNLKYRVIEKKGREEKYITLRNLLQEKKCPTIVYVSRTRLAYELAERLTRDGFPARPYHGQMDAKEKTENQDAFIAGEISIIVATSAFGMGVDKKDVGMVIHFEISDSLENYIQEAGRAGRDEQITADCFILYCEEDLNKHFVLLNQTKINIKEIQQIWKVIKDITRLRRTVSQSALEIARKAGWDEGIEQIEMRVKTAVAALEEAGYIRRGQNMPRVFADSILCRNAQEAIARINASRLFINEQEKETATRIVKKLISSRSRSQTRDQDAETRVDYIADHLGMDKRKVIGAINMLREGGILADAKDLTAYIRKGERINRSLQIFESFSGIEKYLAEVLEEQEATYNIKELNEDAEREGCKDVNPHKIRQILNYWMIKKMIKFRDAGFSKNHVRLTTLASKEEFLELLTKRQELAWFVLYYLHTQGSHLEIEAEKEELLVEFSVNELRKAYTESEQLFELEASAADMEDTLFYLSRLGAIKIEGGFLVVYNPMTIERLEEDNRRRYKTEDYRKLDQFYNHKVQQIHIVGEYARKMLENYQAALQFAEDYFRLNFTSFLQKYFKGSRGEEIRRNISPGKFKQLFGELSPTQLSIIKDKDNKHIVVLAGPGSGKTRVLVHKLASLILLEDVKHEQLLMLTFSRAAATEFKKRLLKLIGNAANFIEIKTFHTFCFDLLGKMGNVGEFDQVVKNAVEKIRSDEVEPSRIAKTVLVIDEAQDMDQEVFDLVRALMVRNEDMRIIAVGDDDQNVFGFRGSSSKYMERLMMENQTARYELLENYRSKSNLVEFFNQFAGLIRGRLKKNKIVAHSRDNGVIRIIRYEHNNLLAPLVEDLSRAELTGSICVLTNTNNEALQVKGLLLQRGIQAKLIQTNEGFRLSDLAELRFFMEQLAADGSTPVVSDDVWNEAKGALANRYGKSELLDTCKRLILDFEATNSNNRYITDLESFIRESRLEDFYPESREIVYVSTIHKAKGKEFDNVFLLLENFQLNKEERKRELYVAMTRAKSNLTIHLRGSYLDLIVAENLIKTEDRSRYELPEKLAMHLGHRDVWLDYSIRCQNEAESLQSGDALYYRGGEWLTDKGLRVLHSSRRFEERLNQVKKNGYEPHSARVNFVVFWRKENGKQEIKIVLPELYLKRKMFEQESIRF